jgi:hypothetical protein
MAKKNKKKNKIRIPRKLARLAWERNGAGQHKDKKHQKNIDECRKWTADQELDN